MTRKPVILLTRSLEVGGTERQILILAKGLKGRGWPVTVVTFYPGGVYQEQLKADGITVACLDKRGRWDTFGCLRRFVALIDINSALIVYSFLVGPNLFSAFLRLFRPKVSLVWGIRYSMLDHLKNEWFVRLGLSLQHILARIPDFIVTNSHAGAKPFTKSVPAKNIKVIPNGIDCGYFSFSLRGRAAIRFEWAVPSDAILVGVVARLDPVKGIECFMVAAKSLIVGHPNMRFVVVGNGNERYRNELTALNSSLGLEQHLRFLAGRHDLPNIYSALDICVSASVSEGFSNVIAEALACECHVIATDVGDSRLIADPVGTLVPRADPGAIAEAIQDAVSRALTVKDRRRADRIVNNFSVDTMLNRVEECFAVMLIR